MKSKKVEYIESLKLNELRYELDKIRARLKEVERLKGMINEIDNPVYDTTLSVLDDDYSLLLSELVLYNSYYDKLRNG